MDANPGHRGRTYVGCNTRAAQVWALGRVLSISSNVSCLYISRHTGLPQAQTQKRQARALDLDLEDLTSEPTRSNVSRPILLHSKLREICLEADVRNQAKLG